MTLQCNIDGRGKRARLIYGIIAIVAAIILAVVWAIPAGGLLPWVVSLILLLGGAFAVFEGWAGWCAMRAMGFKTRI